MTGRDLPERSECEKVKLLQLTHTHTQAHYPLYSQTPFRLGDIEAGPCVSGSASLRQLLHRLIVL